METSSGLSYGRGMELSTEQELRLAALQSRRRAALAPVTMLVSTLDVRASESTRLVTSALKLAPGPVVQVVNLAAQLPETEGLDA